MPFYDDDPYRPSPPVFERGDRVIQTARPDKGVGEVIKRNGDSYQVHFKARMLTCWLYGWELKKSK